MKSFLFIFVLCCLLNTKGFAQQAITVTFSDVIKRDNTLYLQFTDVQKKEWLFNALKSETAPFVFYSTDHSGNITVNPAIRNLHFSIRYTQVTSKGHKENWITGIKEASRPVSK